MLFVAIGESEANRTLLRRLEAVIPAWPRPVLNLPASIARLARDTASELLQSAPGVVMPRSFRIERQTLDRVGRGEQHIACIQEGMDFPVIVRPVGSHAGKGLVKANDPECISEYLQTMPQFEFYVTRFVDYRSKDGLFRKYRVVLIDGQSVQFSLDEAMAAVRSSSGFRQTRPSAAPWESFDSGLRRTS